MTGAIIILFAGYCVASYGVVLLRGYDITLKEWLDPVHPYQWPKGKVPLIPATRVYP